MPSAIAAVPFRLVAAPGEAALVVPDGPATSAWLYNGQAPGPVLRARQGETLNVEVENRLPEPTTIHWHGLRVPVEQDGVPFLSQQPIKPGELFNYRLPLTDAGTFWYHPHINSSEQVGRGLHGLLIVDEPPEVAARLRADRDIAWALDDWRLDQDAQIMPFGGFRDLSHGGRFGNVLTINGTYLTQTELRSGERLRLRICNVANAQSFRLRFAPFDPWVIALDGHPVLPRRLGETGLWLGAGQRVDLILDVDLEPGATARVIDDAYGPDRAFEVMSWSVSAERPLRDQALSAPEGLPANPISPPDMARAIKHELVFEGGAMGGMREVMMGGRMVGMRELAEAGRFWAVNGEVPTGLENTQPLLSFEQGKTQIVTLENRTGWLHPVHLHGHSFHILGSGEDAASGADIRDTVLLHPNEITRIAFVADNPGKWMLHCHVLEHQASGMMGIVEVA
jgi:FtsP/CotA-like multicopper oxidase with cupredoxin domain